MHNNIAGNILPLALLILIQYPCLATETNYVVDDEIIIQIKDTVELSNSRDQLINILEQIIEPKLLNFKALEKLSKPKNYYSSMENLSNFYVLKLNKKQKSKELKKIISNINLQSKRNNNIHIVASPNFIYKGSNDLTNSSTQSLTSSYQNYEWAKNMGQGVIVAVIDSGVNYKHPDIAANIWRNTREVPGNKKDDDANGYIDDIRGWDFIKRAGQRCSKDEDCHAADNDPMDYDGHGTHISGIIAATRNNQTGIGGVAPKARIMPLRAAFSDGKDTYLKSSDIYEAVAYAIDNNAEVINMSFTGPKSYILEELLQTANEMGIVLVAAAGNSGNAYKQYPAATPCVIAVGAVDESNERAYFSNYGSWVDIAAPGTQILSLGGTRKPYEIRSGTSMATPYVAGIAALIKGKNKIRSLSADDIRERILASSVETSYVPVLSSNIINPIEVDDVILDGIATVDDTVELKAIAVGASGYKWDSSLDGALGSSAEISPANLSVGTHKISVSVEGADDKWSKPVSKILRVVGSGKVAEISASKIALDIVRAKDALMARTAGKASKKIAHYLWESTIDGSLPDQKTLPLSSLSPGFHKIVLSIQDRDGNISTGVEQVIQVK